MDFSSQQTVLQNLELRLARIRSALSELTDIQTELQKNASESKNNIQANFSRQLESLRTREVHLINQVDTLLQIKQEHLDLQADSLKKELGALEALLEHARAAGKGVDLRDIEDIMKRFQQFQLEPEEDAALEFVGDPKRLKKAILSYGSINPKRFCPSAKEEDPYAKPGQIMAPFEEFAKGKVWLTPRASRGTKEDTLRMVYPIFHERRDAAGWLSKLNDTPVMETSPSEKSDDDQDSFVMIPQEPERSMHALSVHFGNILTSPDIQWIRPASKTDTVGMSRHQQTKPACSFYRPSGTTKDWLKKDQAIDAQTTCHPSQVPAKPIEIEDLAEMACVQDTPSGAPNPCDPKTNPRPRVQRNQKNTTCRSSKQTPANTTAVNIDEVCKGNEKCKTFEECLGDENCADTARGGFSGIPESSKNQWLAKKPAEEEEKNKPVESKDAQLTRPDEEMPKDDFVKEWLASKTTPTQDYESAILSSFLKWQLDEKPVWLKKDVPTQQQPDQTSVSQWLFKKADAADEPMVVDNKKSSEDVVMKSEWLLPRSLPPDTFAFKVPAQDSTSWLLKGKEDDVPQGSKMDTKQDVLQEKWLMKPTLGGSTFPSKPSLFPFFNAPTGINQWLKQ